MTPQDITLRILRLSYDELDESQKTLIQKAEEVAKVAYAPYSHFHVGAAVQLQSGHIVTGSNQENAAYPSGLCAERTALFSAGANYPNDPVSCLAIIALDYEGHRTPSISPCGGCRQVMVEVASRYGKGFPVLMADADGVTMVADCVDLLPLTFDEGSL